MTPSRPPFIAMTPPPLFRWLPVLPLCALTAATCARASEVSDMHDLFADALTRVDRIVVLPPKHGDLDGRKGDEIVCEITGPAAIAALAEAMEFADWTGMPCLCFGIARLEFFRGERYQFSFSYHHFTHLRSEDGIPWGGDAILSERGRDQFIAWCTAQGYDGFARTLREVDESTARRQHEYDELLALFPSDARALFPERNRNRSFEDRSYAPKVAALFSDPVALVVTCWRALGIEASWWPDGTPRFNSYEEPGNFLRTILEGVDASAIHAALENLRSDDFATWFGATGYLLQSHGRSPHADSITDEWRARLAAPFLYENRPCDLNTLIEALARHPGPKVFDALLDFVAANGARPARPKRPDEYLPDVPSPLATAVLTLARNHHEPARTVIVAKLHSAPLGDERTALEVALAFFDGREEIRPEHIASPYDDIAEAAWTLVTNDNTIEPSLELVLAAARSGSFRVRDAATALLRTLGVQPLKRGDDESVPNTRTIDSALTGEAAIDACTNALAADDSDPRPLLLRRGREHFKLGHYEAARRDLQGLGSKHGDPEALLLVCLALGRTGEAANEANHLRGDRSREPGEAISLYLRSWGLLGWVNGDFARAAEYLAAARKVGYRERTLILEHLARLHLGEGERSGLLDWEPIVLDEDGTRPIDLSTHEPSWPEAALWHLQGKLTAEQMLAATRAPRNADLEARESCEAHFILAELCRIAGDVDGERTHLDACLATRAFATESYVLARLRRQNLAEDNR